MASLKAVLAIASTARSKRNHVPSILLSDFGFTQAKIAQQLVSVMSTKRDDLAASIYANVMEETKFRLLSINTLTSTTLADF
jgi:hypothetical protein